MTDTQDKLSAHWQGPHSIMKQVSPVSCELDMADHRKRKRQFHVNMIAPWNNLTRAELALTITQDDEDDPNNIITLELSQGGCPSISGQLIPE